MVITIAILATNGFIALGIRFIKTFLHFYRGDAFIKFYIFCNEDPYQYLSKEESRHVTPIYSKPDSWRDGTNSKFKNILSMRNVLTNYIFYFDADTAIRKPFDEKWFIGNIVGTEHFDNNKGMKNEKPYDRKPESSCYIDPDTKLDQQYYHGQCFGGRKDKMLDMCLTLLKLQVENAKINHEPIWNDESYINYYFHHNPPNKMIKIKDYEFVVSDKGGIEGLRNPNLELSKLKTRMIKNKNKVYDLFGGKIKVIEGNV